MKNENINVKGCRENNLKNFDVTIPRNKLVLLTGVSGSGKSSLAFDTIYAEGRRKYVESLSAYARQFIGQMKKPDIDSIEGLSPAIAIEQKTINNNPRSTVGTVTEIYDYFRLLFSRAGKPYCPKCGKPINKQSIDQIVDSIVQFEEGTKLIIMAPAIKAKKGTHAKYLESLRKSGYIRVRVDGEIIDLDTEIELDKNKKHDIDVVIDRIVVRDGINQRLTNSVETACALSGGVVTVSVMGGNEYIYSQNFACVDCGINIRDIEPSLFSFNNPSGACEKCMGLGTQTIVDEEMIIPDPSLSILEGAIDVPGWHALTSTDSASYSLMEALSKEYNFSLTEPFEKLTEDAKNVILYGTGGKKVSVGYISGGVKKYYSFAFEGIAENIIRKQTETSSDQARNAYAEYMTEKQCPVCHGQRLRPEALAIKIGDLNISELTDMSVVKIRDFFTNVQFEGQNKYIAEPILKEITARLDFLINVGLDYLTLSRKAGTLSGGESQRIRLATQIGSGLVGVLYILDEPSIGLHQRDNERLIQTLKNLRDMGNTLIVVEHDEDTIKEADYIVDIGPYAGENGGQLLFSGTYNDLLKNEKSITASFLNGKESIAIPEKRKKGNGKKLTIKGAKQNNLKEIDVSIPLGIVNCITGVSGSGKSSLVNDIIYKALARDLNRAKTVPGEYKKILGEKYLDKVIDIDQTPIGKTPRSNPATYTGLFDLIRDLYASTPEAKARGYAKGRFSFNTKGGRCELCSGDGFKKIEMHFLPDVYVPCEACDGKRYNKETLEVKYKGKSISDVLNMTVDEALSFFNNLSRIKNKLQTLKDVGLGYIKLGQSSTTLSGGEAQRVKLATELSKMSTDNTVYILDEPTTGLHSYDVRKLIHILHKLTESGNTVIVIEHNLDVIKTSDYIIDLGPEGGDKGGNIVCFGTPEQVAENKKSYTGKYLKKIFEAQHELCSK